MNRYIVRRLPTVIFKQGVDTNCEVEFDEEKANAKFWNLQSEKGSNDSKNEWHDQKEHIEKHVRDEKAAASSLLNIWEFIRVQPIEINSFTYSRNSNKYQQSENEIKDENKRQHEIQHN